MTLWFGSDAAGDHSAKLEEEIRAEYGQEAVSRGSVHQGRLRLAASAEHAQGRGWADVAALWSVTANPNRASRLEAHAPGS